MIAAFVLASYLVRPGDTLSGIAAANGTSLAAVEAANPGISDPNVIYAGESITLPGSGSYVPPSQNSSRPASVPVQPEGTSGAPGSFQQCVVQHESRGNSQAVNPVSGAGGWYQFLPSTWASLGYSGVPQDASASEQNQAFQKLYAKAGESPWAGDGCLFKVSL